MHKCFSFAIVFAVLAGGLTCVCKADTQTDRIARQFREFCLQESTDHGQRLLDDVEIPTSSPSQLDRYLNSLTADGSWSDINYASKARSAWPPGDHLTRMLAMIVHARQPGIDAAESRRYVDAIHRAMGCWIVHDFKCPNWWYNEIGVPKLLGTIALLTGDDLQSAELAYIDKVAMARSKVGSMTGQNRVWLAGNGVMRAALNHDPGLLKKAVETIADEIRVTDAEGIQPDWSFHQHGPQQQFGNYGMAFAVEMSKWASVLRGTPYALDAEKIGILRNYLLRGQNWVTWHDVMDISSCDRQLFPGSQEKKAGVLRGVFRSMAGADPEKAAEYRSAIDRGNSDHPNDLVGDQVFWRSDYLIYRQPEFMVSLKMSSSRVIGGETVNSENLSGLYLADGAMFIYRTGREFDDVFPVWNWRRIPGTTELQDHSELSWSGKAERLKAAFVGGASDGQTSCAALDFQRGKLSAKKAWFFAGDTVVCLGAGITSAGTDPVETTIEQCLLQGPVMIDQQGSTRGLEGASADLNKAGWVEHAGNRYTSLVHQPVKISCRPRTGNWHLVFENPAAPKADVTKNLFTLSIDHGPHPDNASYAYATTGAGQPADVQVLANTGKLQAVGIGPRWSAAVFWARGLIKLGGTDISVDSPCVLLNDGGKVTVSDPTQLLQSVQVTIAGKQSIVDLPRGGQAGNSRLVEQAH